VARRKRRSARHEQRAIAAGRGISRDAVKFHIRDAMAKLGVPNRQALRRSGWRISAEGRPLAIMAQVKA
jgi:DNA-binding CsgD family transcriptional regulator